MRDSKGPITLIQGVKAVRHGGFANSIGSITVLHGVIIAGLAVNSGAWISGSGSCTAVGPPRNSLQCSRIALNRVPGHTGEAIAGGTGKGATGRDVEPRAPEFATIFVSIAAARIWRAVPASSWRPQPRILPADRQTDPVSVSRELGSDTAAGAFQLSRRQRLSTAGQALRALRSLRSRWCIELPST
jgi:hypothetical protein